jgi:hypothetical protein
VLGVLVHYVGALVVPKGVALVLALAHPIALMAGVHVGVRLPLDLVALALLVVDAVLAMLALLLAAVVVGVGHLAVVVVLSVG